MNLAVIILAAGASARMGRPKLLLPWQGKTVIGHLVDQWQMLGAAPITIVCSPNNAGLLEVIDRLPNMQRVFNPEPERGMFSSIQCAARWEGWPAGLTHWAVSLGDQPLVRLETLQRLLDVAAAHPREICQPSRAGRGRHPVLLPAEAFARLRASAAPDLKQFLQEEGEPPFRCEMDDAGLDLDLDEPSDYESALRLAAGPALRA